MTGKEKRLCARLLEKAGEHFANHGCNDMPKEWFEDWTMKEKREFMRSFHEFNEGAIQRKLEDFELNDPNWLGDSAVMALLAHKLDHEGNHYDED